MARQRSARGTGMQAAPILPTATGPRWRARAAGGGEAAIGPVRRQAVWASESPWATTDANLGAALGDGHSRSRQLQWQYRHVDRRPDRLHVELLVGDDWLDGPAAAVVDVLR